MLVTVPPFVGGMVGGDSNTLAICTCGRSPHRVDSTADSLDPIPYGDPARPDRPRPRRRTAGARPSAPRHDSPRSRRECSRSRRPCRDRASSPRSDRRCRAPAPPRHRRAPREPIQASSTCGSSASIPMVMRKRRPSTASVAPDARPRASSEAVETIEAPAPGRGRSRPPHAPSGPRVRPSGEFGQRLGPRALRRSARGPGGRRSSSRSGRRAARLASTMEPSEKRRMSRPSSTAGRTEQERGQALRIDERTLSVDEVEAPVAPDARRSRARSRPPSAAASTSRA